MQMKQSIEDVNRADKIQMADKSEKTWMEQITYIVDKTDNQTHKTRKTQTEQATKDVERKNKSQNI